METEKLPVAMRMANETDLPFIFNAWLKSHKNSRFAKDIDSTIYFQEHHNLIEKLLKRYDTVVICSKDDPEHIYGFANGGSTEGIFTLNYIYVKHTFRNMGIATTLFNAFEHDSASAGIYTHSNHFSAKMDRKYAMIYHPYAAFKNLDAEQEHVNIKDKQA